MHLSRTIILIGILLCAPLASASEEEGKPLWEYGFGFGHLRFEQYPGSDQYTSLSIPFPTFQYRGEIVRADDREGARAYLLKETSYSLEFSGGGAPPVDSDKNQARIGMKDIPLLAYLGPQLVFKLSEDLDFKLAAFGAFETDFRFTKRAGEVYEAKFDYRWFTDNGQSGRLALNFMFASREFLTHFFEVNSNDVTAERSLYQTQSGYYGTELSYFHAFSSGRTTLYIGATVNDYHWAVNRGSPLHRMDQSINYLAGFTYVLGESKRRSVPADQGDGLFEKLQRRANQQL